MNPPSQLIRPNAPIFLYPSRIKIFGLLLICIVFVSVGVMLMPEHGWIAYLCTAFFSLGMLVFLVQLLPGSSYLRLDESSFTYCSMYRAHTLPWNVVDHFGVVTMYQSGIPAHTMVGFNFIPEYDRSKLGRQLSKAIAECEGALPDTYGMKADLLADLLNQHLDYYRQTRAVQESSNLEHL